MADASKQTESKESQKQMGLFEDLLQMLVNDDAMSKDDLVELYKNVLRKRDLIRKRQKDEKQKQEEAERAEKEEKAKAAAKAEADRKTAEEQAHIDEVTCMDLPLDFENAFDGDAQYAGCRADSPGDALILSLTELGHVDLEFISHACGQPIPACIEALRGSIYRNPETWGECFYRGFETADEYLSGNLMPKYTAAVAANERYNGFFAENVSALEAVLPPHIPAGQIYATLGSPWIPPGLIDAFIEHLLGNDRRRVGNNCTSYNEITKEWVIPYASAYTYNIRAIRTYGTVRINAVDIIEQTMNMRPIRIYDTHYSPTNRTHKTRTLNRDDTMEASDKQRDILLAFRKWIFQDDERRAQLEKIYSERYACCRPRTFHGGFLTLPGANPNIQLYDYQKDAVARILFTKNTLLAHEVGAGKTYIMIAAGMELRRMGISKKNLYVVPNNIIGQWARTFKELYPGASVLTVTPAGFVPAKRRAVLETMRDGTYDAIIIGYSSLEMIPVSPAWKKRCLERRIREVEAAEQNQNRRGRSAEGRKLRRMLDKLEEEAAVLQAEIQQSAPAIYFDDLNVETLFLDEAHNYKNIPIDTKSENVLGINKKGSKKCQEMMERVQLVQEQNNGRGVVFATGTPITNSVTDLFVMQTYLQRGELRFLNIDGFDSWAATFGELTTNFEIDVDASGYRLATRFARFHNLPELAALFAQVADFHRNDAAAAGLPYFGGYTDCVLKKSPEQAAYIRAIAERAERIRAGKVERKEDNMLKITTDGRKAALDIRLVEPDAPPASSSKAVACAEQVFRIWQTQPTATQLVFCDTSTPKDAFNLYDELKMLLTKLGMPPEQIEFIHDATTEKKRDQLFARMNAGELRVLIGSTFKLGLGVNVQNRLFALHHVDIPWRPADMVQREGRILRQGNQNASIEMFRYITDGSFDAYSWQLLETKQRFIAQLLTNSVTERSGTDLDDTVLSYAEVKALAIGNPLIRERVEVSNELSRLKLLRRRQEETASELRASLAAMPQRVANARMAAETTQMDAERYAAAKEPNRSDRREMGAHIIEALAANEMRPEETFLFRYQGFDVMLPAHMLPEQAGVWLCGCGRYYVDIGGSDLGAMVRLDHMLDGLALRAEALTKQADAMADRCHEMERALANPVSYDEEIETLTNRLERIDKKLGVGEQNEKKHK